MKLFFNFLLDAKCLSRSQFSTYENTIRFFKYHPNDRQNAPTRIHFEALFYSKIALHMTASNCWAFLQLLPFYEFPFDIKSSPKWTSIKYLMQIASLVTSRRFTKVMLIRAKCLARLLIRAIISDFPNANLIPKIHYLLHIIENIRRIGPPATFWAMRFEAKHHFLKNVNKFSNFHNLMSNISTNSAIQIAWLSHTDDVNRFSSPILDSHSQVNNSLSDPCCSNSRTVSHSISEGDKYFVSSIVLVHREPNVYGEILQIFRCDTHSEIIFEVQLLRTLSFEEDANAYSVAISQRILRLSSSSLPAFEPHSFYASRVHDNTFFVPLKRCV